MSQHWILGPGAIGRLLAHTLAPHVETVLVGRRALPPHQRLRTPEGDWQTRDLRVVTPSLLTPSAFAPPEFLHLTTKAMAAEKALESVASKLAPTTTLVLWQNGFLAQPNLTAQWPGPVLCATTTEGAYVDGDDGIVHAGRGQTFIGDLHGRHHERAQGLATLLTRAGLSATAVADIRHRLWQKLLVNAAINPLVAIHGVRNGALREAPFANQVEAVVAEVVPILQAEGITPPAGQNDFPTWRALVGDVIERTANNKASMLQDMEAKRPTERAAILGPLIDSAGRRGLPCQLLRELDDRLAAIEARTGECQR